MTGANSSTGLAEVQRTPGSSGLASLALRAKVTNRYRQQAEEEASLS